MLLARRVARVPQGADRMGLGLEPLEIVDEAPPAVLRVFVVDPYVNRLLGAHFLAVAAEHAAEFVDLVDQGIAVSLLVLARHQLDAVGRADLGTQSAGHALRAALLVGHHPVGAPPARRESPLPHAMRAVGALLLRVLHGDPLLEHVLEGERHALQRGPHVAHLPLGTLQNLDADRHQELAGRRWAWRIAAARARRTAEPPRMSPRSSTRKRSIA